MGNLIDLTGQRFGRLTVIERTGSDCIGQAMWRCRCDCGNMTVVAGGNLRTGNTRSCGCYGLELTIGGHRSRTHGGTYDGGIEPDEDFTSAAMYVDYVRVYEKI